MHLHAEIVNLPTKDHALHQRIAEDKKYFPYFQDCLGVLDGTHIPAHIPSINGAAYRNRKGVLSQNVLRVCTMDLQFCYVLAGWEGSAHDDKVLEDALFDKNFMIPNKKYYLADAEYHNTDYLLYPYRCTRYHLKEQAMAGQKPTNKKELFNLCHFTLQNVVERMFSITKHCFQILETLAEFAMVVQVKIVLAVTGLHNFIQSHRTTGDIYDKAQFDAKRLLMRLSRGEEQGIDRVTHTSANTSKEDGARMNRFRDEIAEAMWQDYISY